jgi:hypothetical protein
VNVFKSLDRYIISHTYSPQSDKWFWINLRYNVRDQRRRAVGAPLADRTLPKQLAVLESGVPTRDDRCIA